MSGNMPEDVYCTLLLNDAYLPGVEVLAHSLRDAGTTKRLAVMVVLASVSGDTVNELKKLYDYVIPVDPHSSQSSEGLSLMKRLDLSGALTKIELWKQTQFRKVVYLDADVLALRAPDELFDVEADFAACPDVGWPDCFNSGVMVVKPNMDTYEELVNLAEKGETYDGADQGLLNQHFENWHRLSFGYNCTVAGSMAYQYAPALRHYGSKVSMVHFIGQSKPWNRGYTPGLSQSADPYDKFNTQWWSVYNKHHGAGVRNTGTQPPQYNSRGVNAPTSNGGFHSAVRSFSANNINTGNYISHTSSFQGTQVGGSRQKSLQHRSGDAESKATVHTTPDVESQSHRESKFVPIRSIAQPSIPEKQQPQSEPTHPLQHIGPAPKAELPPQRIIIGSGPTTDGPPTHYQHYVSEGRLEEFVLTRGGPVSQDRYFRTGAWTYYVQQCGPDGKPIVSEEVQKPGKYFHAWDPTKFAPPQNGAPEADRLYVQVYENEWDHQDGTPQPYAAPEFAPPSKLHLWYDLPQTPPAPGQVPAKKAIFPWEEKPRKVARVFHDSPPESNHPHEEEKDLLLRDPVVSADCADAFNHQHLKPVFPWEERPRKVTRVFAGEERSVPSQQYEEGYRHVEDEYQQEENGGWDRFPTRENLWDTDPAIRDYVLGLRRHRSQVPRKVAHGDNLVDNPPAPAMSTHTVQVDKSPQEDQELDFEDNSIGVVLDKTVMYSNSSMQTEPLTLADIGTQYGNPLDLSDIGTQYGSPLDLSDIGTQCGYDDEDAQSLDNREDYDGLEKLRISKIDMTTPYRYRRLSYDEGEEVRGRKHFTRGRSIDSALGSAISDD